MIGANKGRKFREGPVKHIPQPQPSEEEMKKETARPPGWDSPDSIKAMQTAVFVMCGGGQLGSFAAQQPADFYIDSRVGKLPYTRTQIKTAVDVLKAAAIAANLDPHHLKYTSFHNMGVF